MTTVEVTPEGNPTTTLTGKKLVANKTSPKPRVSRYVLFAVLGALVAICVTLLLSFQKAPNKGQFVPVITQQPELEQQPVPHYSRMHDDNNEFGHVIGIELGEALSRVGASVSSEMEIFYIDGQLQIPNYVAYTDEGVLVGQEAKDQALANPKNTIFDVRYLIGRKFSKDPSLQSDIDLLPYNVINKDDEPCFNVRLYGHEKLVSPEEVQAEIIRNLKMAAEKYYGEKVTSAVVTVPANFDDNQRQATKNAALIAGLNVLRLVNEPVAAGIGYGLLLPGYEKYERDELFVVYGLGEKSVDVTVASIDMGVFEILAQSGDRSIGGQDLDNALLDYTLEEFQHKTRDSDSQVIFQNFESLNAQVKKAEQTISTRALATIQVGKFSLTITRRLLYYLYKDVFDQSIKHIEAVLDKAKLQKAHISHLILTGSQSQVSKIQPFLEAFFDGKKVLSEVSFDQAILRGAVYQAEILSGDSLVDWVGNFDTTALSMGIEVSGGLYTKIIPRHTMLPTIKSKNITTIHDNQTKISVKIVEGERALVLNNKILGTLEMADLPARPAGELIIEVAFDMYTDNLLTVTARELESGRQEVFTSHFDPDIWYDKVDIDAVLEDAEVHAEEDFKMRAEVEKRQSGDIGEEFGVVVVQIPAES